MASVLFAAKYFRSFCSVRIKFTTNYVRNGGKDRKNRASPRILINATIIAGAFEDERHISFLVLLIQTYPREGGSYLNKTGQRGAGLGKIKDAARKGLVIDIHLRMF